MTVQNFNVGLFIVKSPTETPDTHEFVYVPIFRWFMAYLGLGVHVYKEA